MKHRLDQNEGPKVRSRSEVIYTEHNLLHWWKLNQQNCIEQYRFSVHY